MARYGYNYLAPLSQRQLQRQIRRSVGAQVNPYLAQNRRETQFGQAAISAYSDQLAHELLGAQSQTRANYGQAEASQASINAALANRLSGAGSALSNDLSRQLAQAGQSTAPAAAVGQIGTGASNAGFASGTASLSALLAQGAAAQQYAGQLPLIARMQGQQQLGLFSSAQAKARGEILNKVPGLIDSETKNALANEFQKAVAVQSGLVSGAKLQETAAYHRASINARNRATTASNQRSSASLAARAKSDAAKLAETRRYHDLSIHAREVANDISRYRAHHPRSRTRGFTPSQAAKYRGQGVEAAIAHKDQGDTAIATYRSLYNKGMPPRYAAWAVGRVYGKWLKPGDKKRLGIR